MVEELLAQIDLLDDKRKRLLIRRLLAMTEREQSPPRIVRLVAVVVGRIQDKAGLRSFCENRLPSHMVPQVFAEVSQLPKTAAGKIDRQAFKSQVWHAEPSGQDELVLPRNDVERKLVEIWCDVLGFDEISVNDNFFEVGGDSLLTIRILSRAAKEGMRISPELFFANPTIGAQARLVEASLEQQNQSSESSGNVPLLPIQEWFFQHIRTDRHHWNQSYLFSIDKSIDVARIEAVFEQILDHHAALRTRFDLHGTHTAYIPEETAGVKIREIDLEFVDGDVAEKRMRQTADELNADLDLAKEPLIRVAYFRVGSLDRNRLLVIVHHLVIDEESTRILIDDLQTLLRRTNADVPDNTLPLSTPLLTWATELRKLAHGRSLLADLAYWNQKLDTRPSVLPKDFEHSAMENTEADAVVATFWLDAANTSRLMQAATTAMRATPHLMLLSALARTMAEWTKNTRVVFDLEGHGRESLSNGIDVSRTIGWLTTVYPLVLDPPEPATWDDAISALRYTKEAVGNLPRNGLSFGVLRNYCPSDTDCAKLARYAGSEVLFNFLGSTDRKADDSAEIRLVDSRYGAARSGRCERAFLVEINTRISLGKLQADVTFNHKIHSPTTIDMLGHVFLEKIRELVSGETQLQSSATVASDFPLAGLDAGELEHVAAQVDAIDDD